MTPGSVLRRSSAREARGRSSGCARTGVHLFAAVAVLALLPAETVFRMALGDAALAFAQQAEHAGRVFDTLSRAGVSAARVTWVAGGAMPAAWGQENGHGLGVAVLADERGKFAVPAAWGPGASFKVTAPGFRTRVVTWEEAAANSWQIALEHTPVAFDEIVVTATGRAQRRSEVALPVEVIGASDVSSAGAPSADRLLSELPALQAAGGTPTGANVAIRGIGGPRVLILLDGQPTAGALLENRDLSRMSLAGADRVEVVKGPLSSLYGSDALGGVVNIITAAPEPGFRGGLQVRVGEAGRREASATASGGGRLRYRVSGSWRQEDRVPGLENWQDAFARVWDLRSTLRFDASSAVELRADANILRERQRWPAGAGFSGFNDNTGVTGWSEVRWNAGPGQLTGRLFAQRYDHLFRSARGTAPTAGGRDKTQKEALAKAAVGYSLGLGNHHVDLGFEGSRRSIESPDKLLEDRAADAQIEAFAQDAWKLGSATLSAGARLTRNSRWGSTLSPSFGLTRPLGRTLSFRGTVARGFRAPSFKELAWNFANFGGGYILQGFPDLEPERSWSASAGLAWRPGNLVRIDADVFTSQIDNLIEANFVDYTPGGLLVYSPRNVAQAVTQGFEIAIRAVSDRGDFAAGYQYLDARALDPDLPLDRRAAHSGRARVLWTLERLHGLQLNLTGHVTGASPVIGTDENGLRARVGTQERLTALDVRLALRILGSLVLSFGVDNVFDARPGGWQSAVERRARIGLALDNLFAR